MFFKRKEKHSPHIYKRLVSLAKPQWRRLLLAMLCMLGVAACTAASAYLIKPVLDDVFINKRQDMLRTLPLLVLGLFVVKGLFAWGNSYLMSYVGQRTIANMRHQIYSHVQGLQVSFFDRTPTGKLMSRITNDVNQMQGAVSDTITSVLKDSFSIIGLIGVIFYRDWELALVAMIVLPLAIYPIVKFGKMLRKNSTKSQRSMGNISVILHETIMGNRIVKAFGMEDYERARFGVANEKFFSFVMKSIIIKSVSSPVMELLGGLGIVFIIWYGGASVISGVSTPGNFFSFLAAMILLYEPVKRLSNSNNTIQQGIAAAERVFHILDMEPEIRDLPSAIALPQIQREIEFRGVSFGYESKPILTEINLKVAAGEILAIVGVSGAGKTTLVNLIPRFYDPVEGSILIDGTDIREATIASLRSQIGVVTQQSILFNDTVRNNIGYGDIRKSEQEIIEAAKAANAYDFVMRLPHGFDTIIGEQGARLSGGERQRICIARALLKNAPILILDEATSSLDSESELEVQRALDALMSGRTTLVIAHRLSTIKNADRIIALAGGRIAEEGKHFDLLGRRGEYSRLYELQYAQYEPDPGRAAASPAGRTR